MPSTLRDVATAAQVSVMTASRALRGDSVAPKTRARVRAACSQVGYRPHLGARATRANKFRQVACVVLQSGGRERPAWPRSASYLSGLAEELGDRAYALLPQPMRADAEGTLFEPPRVFHESAVDGVIAVATAARAPQAVHQRLRKLKLPMVWLNTDQFADCPCIHCDEAANATQLIGHLTSLGHRKIAYVGPADGHESARRRRAGVQAALTAAGLEPAATLAWEQPRGGEMLEDCVALLSGDETPTAVIGFNEQVLQTLVQAANRAGRKIPADLSIAGFASPWVADRIDCPTYVEVPEHEMARRAVEALMVLIDDEPSPAVEPVPGVLRPGSTTAAAPDQRLSLSRS